MRTNDFALRGDHITLDALLKATGLAGSGGDAKRLIVAGEVSVNGAVETRRGRKVRAADVVALGDQQVQVQGPGSDTAALRSSPSS
jgi:ribosome-associated protein